MMVLGVGLLASGLQGLYQYWKELCLFGLLMLNPLLKFGLELSNLPRLTAQTAAFMLWYTGFDVRLEGLSLLLPTGRVDVYGACSGVGSMLQMLYISVLFLLLFSLRSTLQQVLAVLLAVLIGFLVNAARVALMAVLVAFSQKSAFDYWHTGDGSLIFAAIAVGLFGDVLLAGLFTHASSRFRFRKPIQWLTDSGTLSRMTLLIVSFSGALFVLGKAIVAPKAAEPQPAARLPTTVPLAGWQGAASAVLPPIPESIAGQEYQYRRHAELLKAELLKVELHYMTGDGDVNRFLFVHTPIRQENNRLFVEISADDRVLRSPAPSRACLSERLH